MATSKPDPGPHATPEERRRTKAEVEQLIENIEGWNTPKAAAYIRANPPSAEAIAALAFYWDEMQQSRRARAPRNGVTADDIEQSRLKVIRRHGSDEGWKGKVCEELSISYRTLAKRLKET